MSKNLTDIAKQLSTPKTVKKTVPANSKTKEVEEFKPVPKVQLIYAFNGTGKTRLSLALKKLISPKLQDVEDLFEVDDILEVGETRKKFLYYNAFTEDLFYWDNDLEADTEPKLKIQRNSFTDWILTEQGDVNIIENFQRYTNKNLIPKFIEKEEIHKDKDGRNIKVKTYPEVMFTTSDTSPENIDESDIKIDENDLVKRDRDKKIKISKGEESNFVWSVFYTLLQEVISILSEPDPAKRADNQFDQLEYIFIDDPVSSLDENHLIELAVNLAMLVKSSTFTNGEGLKFVITTHNPLFYNVLWNEFSNDLYKDFPDGKKQCLYKRDQSKKYRLDKKADGTFELIDSNDHPFSYHLFLLSELRDAIDAGQIKKYHFNFLRNILEKTATFLGHNRWEGLLQKVDGHPDPFANRILNLSSHSAHAGEETADITDDDKEKLHELITFLIKTYGFKEERKQNG